MLKFYDGCLERVSGWHLSIKNKARIVLAIAVAVISALVLYGLTAISEVKSLEAEWSEYSAKSVRKYEMLLELQSSMGYGGFIHNFKNYILRFDEKYFQQVNDDLSHVRGLLYTLMRNVENERERESYRAIEYTINQYASKLDQAYVMVSDGVEINKIDEVVKVDDSAAINAFEWLRQQHIQEQMRAEHHTTVEINHLIVHLQWGGVFLVVFLGYAFYSAKNLRNFLKSQKQLESSEWESSEIIEVNPKPMIVTSFDGSILRVNQAAISLFGYSREGFCGLKIEDLIPHIGHLNYSSLSKKYARIDTSVNGVAARRTSTMDSSLLLQAFKKNGESFEVDLMFGVASEEGEGKVVVSVRDVTEMKKHEAEMERARDEATMANRAKSRFLANMSHEIRTPMNAVIGLSQLCLNTELNDTQKCYLEKIYGSSKLLLGIINDVMDFATIEAGELRLERREFSLRRIINDVQVVNEKLIEEKGLQFSVDIEHDMPDAFRGDDLRISQVLINLVNNAVKFTEQGKVTVSVNQVCNQNDDIKLNISVHDTGIGMSPDQLKSIFDEFNQVDVSTTRKHGGTGLGLSISKLLAELMGGEIYISSTPGIGSQVTLILTLPMIKKAENSKLDILPSDKQAGNDSTHIDVVEELDGVNVLLVEDIDVNAIVATALLEEMGMNVTCAVNGRDAITKLASNKIDVVLMDIQMPEMDGIEATQSILEDERFKDLKIIALTANAMDEDRHTAIEAGMVDHVAKPIVPDLLQSVLIKWAGKTVRKAS